jgi:hypothetical protein
MRPSAVRGIVSCMAKQHGGQLMRRTKSGTKDARLEKVRSRFERWRKSKEGRSRIPETLWRAAVRLASHYSVHQISRALRLNHTDLKKRVDAVEGADRSERDSRPTFVEVDLRESGGPAECVVELENSSGARMRIQLKGTVPDLTALSRSFWSGEA